MLFSSCSFLFCFLPLFLLAWQLAGLSRQPQAQALALLLFSLIFYAFWGLAFLALFLAMICGNYLLGLAISQTEPKSGKLLFCALAFNLAPLLWFKYSWFIIRNLALLFHADWQFTPPALPLGISFYTFIQIAWLVAVHRGQIKPEGILRHALFSSCFPYVISGPIVRYEQMGWQLDGLKETSAASLAMGFSLFSMGLAKKIILADSIGVYADAVFGAAEKGWPVSCAEAWLGSLSYTFQLYFDFSGYTDMALALGLMIGLRLPENFNSPYKSTGIVDFWRRWHITLSSWLRDFLYIPLGGNRRGKPRQYLNLFLTMLIGGAWHGAGWTYIIWGAAHGLMLAINHFFRSLVRGSQAETLLQSLPARIVFILLTFFCLNICWVVFRALSLDGALAMYHAMFAAPGAAFANWDALLPNNYLTGWQPFALLGACAALCWFFPNSHQILYGQSGLRLMRWRESGAWAIGLALLAFASLLFMSRQSTFLYFQF